MRFDFVGPLGFGSGAAVVIGDQVAWSDPERNFRSLVPAIPMLWASLGMVQPPGDSAAVFRGVGGEGQAPGSAAAARAARALWRFADEGDTLDYVATNGVERMLEAEWRRRGTVVARSRTALDAQARPTGARVDFPEASARFELTVVGVDTAAVIPPALWRSRR